LRNAGPRQLNDGRRPQLGFDEDSEVRPPVIEETADQRCDVDRGELVAGAGRQPRRRNARRTHGDRGEDDGDAGFGQLADERHHRVGLADARGVDPGEPPCRPW
jgi:hypothetical protein